MFISSFGSYGAVRLTDPNDRSPEERKAVLMASIAVVRGIVECLLDTRWLR